MSDTLVRVLCGECGNLVCRVMAADDGRVYYKCVAGNGMTTYDPRGVFCSAHGWPDLAHPALAAKVAKARGHDRIAVFRAPMSTRPPTVS